MAAQVYFMGKRQKKVVSVTLLNEHVEWLEVWTSGLEPYCGSQKAQSCLQCRFMSY